MSVRLILDESSWGAASVLDEPVLQGFSSLADLLDTATERSESVGRHADFYEAEVGAGARLYDLLFAPSGLQSVDYDLCSRLTVAFDRALIVQDANMVGLDATYNGIMNFAPGVSWAHAEVADNHMVAVLPLAVGGLGGEIEVTVQGVKQTLHFVTTEEGHVRFFRCAILAERMDHAAIRGVARSAFPALDWVDLAWNDLRVHRAHFFDEHLPTLVEHLSALNDRAAQLFHQRPGGADVEQGLAALGVSASAENGRARGDNACKRDRTRRYNANDEVFWWHTKIRHDKGRIHFLHVPNSIGCSDRPVHGHVVIGICKDHCLLP